ncbi:uncharacterized protein LOC107225314 isoform X1 [Neodiprion lecontei]|uniref:Uncharacterized protein LOC107225314 isoform X1 n=1 Tax=Neodiprion lecontei TaxID=441921 RepID=A0ABM3G537_NEOLC|nr:uncharacterized protein LOC107225314 isoform X1 [Neodiprion lecontei]
MGFPTFDSRKELAPIRETGRKKFEFWNMAVVAMMAIGIGLLLATYVLAGSSTREKSVQDSNEASEISGLNFGQNTTDENLTLINQRLLPMSQIYCRIETNCVVTCSRIPAASSPGIIATVFMDSEYKRQCAEKELVEELVFDNCRFPSNELSSEWLPIKFRLRKLTLRRCGLTAIDVDAFRSKPFQELRGLAIIGNRINALRKSLFDGLTSLEELAIVDNSIVLPEPELLVGTANSLQILQLDNAIRGERTLTKVIGSRPLRRVIVLSLTRNRLPKLSRNIFKGVPNVQSVHLTDSGVSMIEPGALDPFSRSIRQLFLARNNLTYLPTNAFSRILRSNPNFRVTLANNDWNCSCGLNWLKNLTTILIDVPRCSRPDRNAMLSFTEADFCEQSDRPSTAVLESTDEPVKGDPESMTLTCDQKDQEADTRTTRRLLSVREFIVRTGYPGFFLSQVTNGSVHVVVGSEATSYTLVWFVKDLEDIEPQSVKCVTDVAGSVTLTELQPGLVYIVCLLDRNNGDLTSPFNCQSIQMPNKESGRLWLTDEAKTPIIGGLTVVLVVVCVSGAMGSYCIVRRNPRLLKGSKRIIMVNHRAADAIVLPADCRLDSLSNTGSFARVPGPTVSSSRSSTTSYVSGIQPTRMQLLSWRIGRIREILACDNPNKFNAEIPPPLPPPRNKSVVPSLSRSLEEAGTGLQERERSRSVSDFRTNEEEVL